MLSYKNNPLSIKLRPSTPHQLHLFLISHPSNNPISKFYGSNVTTVKLTIMETQYRIICGNGDEYTTFSLRTAWAYTLQDERTTIFKEQVNIDELPF